MAIKRNWPTSATLQGAVELNRIHLKAQQEDLGFRMERLISALSMVQSLVSAVNILQSAVSGIHLALGSAASSIAGASLFSVFSAYAGGGTNSGTVSAQATITAVSALSNFRASHPA